IPHRTVIYKTLSPSGGDDTPTIQEAVNSCPPNQVVQLTAGVFNLNQGGIGIHKSNITLRGAGPGKGFTCSQDMRNAGAPIGIFVADPTATQLYQHLPGNQGSNGSGELISCGYNGTGGGNFRDITNLAADAPFGAKSITLVSNPNFKVGDMVLLDQNTTNHPYVFWGLAHDPPGGCSRRWFRPPAPSTHPTF